MSFNVNVTWRCATTATLPPTDFCRDHHIVFGSGQAVHASSAAQYHGNADLVNPEESLLAALSSCHMLTFLTIAHIKRLPVVSYQDHAEALLSKNAHGKLFISHISLKPQVTFAAGITVDTKTMSKIHDKAHANCFIANSLNPQTIVEVINLNPSFI